MRIAAIPPLLAVIVVTSIAAHGPQQVHAPVYQRVTELKVGGEGGWDFLTVEPSTRRLYAAHSTHVAVVDIDQNRILGYVEDTPGVHKFLAIPSLNRGFSSNGGDDTSTVVELKTLRAIKKVKTGPNPDAMVYVPDRQEVYTFNADRSGRDYSATVISAKSGDVVVTIPMPGKPELAVLDLDAHRVYDAIQDKDLVVVIDTTTHAIVASWPTAPGKEATGLAIDTANHRLFVGCGNGRLVMMDSRTGALLDAVPTGTGNDGVEFDPGTGLIFSADADGTLTIARVTADSKLNVVQTLITPWRSKTMALDPVTHRIYVASGLYERLPRSTSASPPKPIPIDGSFTVLVFGPQPPSGSRQ